MGCSQSKIENEEAVARCKERKHFMKLAVSARNAFAAAHSAYATSLKGAGAALTDFAQGEVVDPQFPPSAAAAAAAIPAIAAVNDIKPPPPPPSLAEQPQPLQRATTMPEKMIKDESKRAGSKKQVIKEEEGADGDDEIELENNEGNLRTRRRRSNRTIEEKNQHHDRKHDHDHGHGHSHVHALQHTHQTAAMEYFFPSVENVPGTSLKDSEEVLGEEEQEENHHHHHHHNNNNNNHKMSKKDERIHNHRKVFVEEKGHGEIDDDEDVDGIDDDEPVAPLPDEEAVALPPAPEAMAMATTSSSKALKKVKIVPPVEAKRNGKQGVNMMQVFTELDDHFLKASESAHEVSKMLEATRLHYHSNFADNRGHIDHAAKVMRVITWNRSFRGIPNLDEGKDDVDLEEHETHATVLDKLLAWEKKLYDEVKAGELMKYEYQKKVAMLNKLKNRGSNSEALEKAKAAVSHLHTRYIVDMQALDSTVSEISRLRDQQLYPRLVQLVDGMATMWGIMQFHHENQSSIVTALRLLDISQSPTETSEQHYERTQQLCAVVQQWQAHFEKLMIHQREYIKALNSWLKQNLIPIESNLKEKVSSPQRARKPPIHSLLIAWQDHLEKLPDEDARTAITNFAAVIETICQHQEEELALKRKCEETRKELMRKKRQFEDWYRKYMEKKIPEDFDPERTEANNPDETIINRKFLVDQVEKRLEDEEEAYARQCLQVRQKSLGSLKNRLPELFRAMSNFSHECAKMYSELRSITQNQGLGQRSSEN
ncbi:hypothetical protein HN51_026872 [Arachis hypogaea]|uniref:DUF632 domain-containing protein n=1 Tax=Arachis hypogaea TaxID=3818 RepID=A0A445BQ53_ARAHY|nr:nitrate regulatory gene2 protein [Arachis hypogaea]QHO33097.1 uncharacterized protein DS421_9g255360 [Arachis hypogaea]RYR40810.1 hypothetical protein Ahy_A09g046558 isoform A [Arachis hypogaea]RYR40811.1 hypothetical protein Ahy_A09g046558 isoform B [Arachis hypogaea]